MDVGSRPAWQDDIVLMIMILFCYLSYQNDNRNARNGVMDATDPFQKHWEFKIYPDWKLPDKENFFREKVWVKKEFQDLKTELNGFKSQLNDKDLQSWHKHTKGMDPFKPHMKFLEEKYDAEVFTRAWLKMYEIMDQLTLTTCDGKFNTLHLCEAPGAFIASINHYLKTHGKENVKSWSWLATSLHPHYEGTSCLQMINKDGAILASRNNWTFFEDGTGNIIQENNIDELVEECGRKLNGKVNLVTADGGIDCFLNPAEQEMMSTPLIFAEVIAALSTLNTNGQLILKLFTTFECNTICIIFMLCVTFEKLHFVKPCSSGDSNSEVYLVCINFKGRKTVQEDLDLLKKYIRGGFFTIDKYAIFPESTLPKPFLEELRFVSKFFFEFQIQALQKKMAYVSGSNKFNRRIIRGEKVLKQWEANFNVKRLPESSRIFSNFSNFNASDHDNSGSFNQRAETGDILNTSLQFESYIRNTIAREFIFGFNTKQKTYKSDPAFQFLIPRTTDKVVYKYGIAFQHIRNSPFNFPRLLHFRHRIKQLCKFNHDRLNMNDQHICHSGEFLRFHEAESSLEDGDCSFECFHESAHDFAAFSDAEKTKLNLQRLHQRLEFLPDGSSLFLCEFRVLTRVELGVCFLLARVFKETRFVITKDFCGLYCCQLCKSADSAAIIDDIRILTLLLKDGENCSTCLEIFEGNHLFESTLRYNLLSYNATNTYRSLNNQLLGIGT